MMKSTHKLDSLVFKFLLIILSLTGIYILFFGQTNSDAQIIQCQDKSFNKGWFYYDSNGNEVQIPSLPANISSSDNKSAIYHRLPPEQKNCQSFCFYSHHQNVRIKLNDQIIYTYQNKIKPKNILSYHPVYNLVTLPPVSSESIICIETEALLKSTAGDFEEAFYGDKTQILFTIIWKHITNFFLGVMFIIVSIFLFGTHNLFAHTNKKDYTLLHLGLLTFGIGCWQLDDSSLLLFFTGKLHFLWCLKYLSQLFIPLFTLLFMRSISVKKDNKFLRIFFWITVTIVSTQYVLQIFGIRALTNTNFASHVVYLATCIYAFKILARGELIKNSKLKYLFILSMIFSMTIFAFTAVSLFNNKFFNSLMSFGIAFCFIWMILITYQKELKIFEEVNKAAMYKTLAFVDIATGVNNKTAWYTLIDNFNEQTRPQGEYCLIVFDMNNLKKLNDNYGHLIGDKVIKAFCDCLVKVVGTMGKIYRIGGDEFVCVCNNFHRENIMTMLHNFDEAIANQEECEHKFSAAYGFEFFTPHSPADFKKALESADEKMYNAKVAMKAARK